MGKHKCPSLGNKDVKQMLLETTERKLQIRDRNIDPDIVREKVIRLVVRNELPLRFVEYPDFRGLMTYIYPEYQCMSRNTLMTYIILDYKKEKKLIRDLVRNHANRVSFTTDCWTSITGERYMVLTAHYIDDSWTLHKRLIKFALLAPPHSGVNIEKVIRKTLGTDWGLEGKVMSFTVDNASANDSFVSLFKAHLNTKNLLLRRGKYLHIRCCPHILNLIVQSGLKEIDAAVEKVRKFLKYIKNSQARKVRFKECCDIVNCLTNKGLHMDVSTRWNSTYAMLSDAVHYKDGLDYYGMELEDAGEVSDEDSFVPTFEQWQRIERIVKLLRPFSEITVKLSGSLYPTSSIYFTSVVQVYEVLNNNSLLSDMAGMMAPMVAKFNKYWEDFSMILSIAAVLDPRYKEDILIWGYLKIHKGDENLATASVKQVIDAMKQLFDEYKDSPVQTNEAPVNALESSLTQSDMDFLSFKRRTTMLGTNAKSELDLYLEERTKPIEAGQYDILRFWRESASVYPTLAKLARDVLAIPVSTVASESAFSAGGRVIDKYRSRLLPANAEALICLRDWMIAGRVESEEDKPDTNFLDDDLGDVDVDMTIDDFLVVPLTPAIAEGDAPSASVSASPTEMELDD